MAAAAVTGMLCGLSSIPGATRVSLTSVLSGGTPTVTGWTAMRRVLLSTEVAMTFVLVVGAALLVQTLWNLSAKERGFEADRLLTVRVSPGTPRHLDRTVDRAASRYFAAFFSDMRDRLERIPSLASAGAVSLAPLAGTASRLANVVVDGRVDSTGTSSTPIAFVTPGYLRTMRIRVIAGRDFDGRDQLGAERVVIVNEAFQRRFAPGATSLARGSLRYGSVHRRRPHRGCAGSFAAGGSRAAPDGAARADARRSLHLDGVDVRPSNC